MMRMWEHIDRLDFPHGVCLVQQIQVTGLRGWITTYINDTFGTREQDCLDYVIMHTGTWRVGDDYIRSSMFVDEILSKQIFHVAGKKFRIRNAVERRVHLSVLDSFRNIFNADHLFGLTGNEIGDSPRPGIKVIDQLGTRESGKIPCHTIQMISLFAIGDRKILLRS